ncbi:hypothetical protein AURDEDRAFT_174902 [Auricularia subglabra TFB-10046 SS5]|nr:hypothetical protein AURDEDRAFT_174902 [Auricularia subglabra TFB-10046 SS5]
MLNGSSDVGPSIPFRRMILTLRDGPGGNDAALLAVMRAYPSISLNDASLWLSTLEDCTLECPLSLCPTRRRPPIAEDVLVMIFIQLLQLSYPHFIPSKPFIAQRVLSLVCRSWRQAALNTPALWRFLYLDCSSARSPEDLYARRSYVAYSVSRSRGIVYHLYVSNFAGPALTLGGFPAFWKDVTTRVLPICEKLYLVFPDGDPAGTQCAIRIGAALSMLASCVAPRLNEVAITAGNFKQPSRVRYSLHGPLFTPETTPSLESLTINCVRVAAWSSTSCNAPNVTHLAFCGGAFEEVEHLVVRCLATLQSLKLLAVQFSSFPDITPRQSRLSSLTLSGSSAALLSCLRNTTLLGLQDLNIEFDGTNHAAHHLLAFMLRHSESPISSLSLRRRSNTGRFSDFIPAIRQMDHLRTLVLRGDIEPAFFAILADILTDELAHELRNMALSYSGPLDYLAPSLLQFLTKKAAMTNDWALDILDLFMPRGSSCTPPFDYATTRILDRSVWGGGFLIMDKLVDRRLNDPSYWLSVRQTQLVCTIVVLGLFAFYVVLAPELPHEATYACYILWFALLAKNVFMTFLEERRALSLIARSWLILWQLVLGGQFVYYSAYLVALMYGV